MRELYDNYVTTFWLDRQFGAGKYKWKTLRHNGVLFPPPYKKHNIPIIYQLEAIILDEQAEEYATLYAKYSETDYVKNSIFKRNFWKDWVKILGKDHKIKNLDGCDFKLIYDYLIQEKELKKSAPKVDNEEIEKKYKTAIVDGVEQPVGNFRVEPPGLFIGRGCNPKLGRIKRRVYPKDITINIGSGEPIPDTGSDGKWGEIVHNREVEWLAAWKDDITGKTKYVWLAAQSDQKGKNDAAKFDLARKLKKKIKMIEEKNIENLRSDDLFLRQLSTAFYFIDKFALRVGNEKGSDETDTVGVTSLRVEHIKLLDSDKIELDFLGKDSIRYKRVLTVDPVVYKNISEFIKSKDLSDQLFDKINSGDINKYLSGFMTGLTAKVFRTYNASYLFQKELKKISKKYDTYNEADKINILLDEFNKANAKVAMLCNHQKNVTKSSVEQIKKIDEQIKSTRTKIKKLKKDEKKNAAKIENERQRIKKLKAKKELKIELKNISLGTSKINYIDPRITIAFLKKHGIDVGKVFSKTLQEKFKWAFDASETYKF
uniref:DNA topoisomerase 1 n=1 Tax=viral metagenome TaxID=1070528 RepID=A0A6C0C987_9ZZZZ